jgi:hypothetical protein
VAVRYVPREPDIVRAADQPIVQPILFVIGGILAAVGIGVSVYAWRSMPSS